MTNIILLAHGSPDPRSGNAMRRFAEKIQTSTAMPTQVAFLDHEGPNLNEIARGLNSDEVLVVPMLLSNAFHARFDVPKAMEQAGLHRLLPPIGHPAAILRTLIRMNGPHVVVAAAGSTNEGARQVFRDAVEMASLHTEIDARPAFVTNAHSSLRSLLESMRDTPSKEITIIPWLFAEGRLLDAILVLAQEHGVSVLDHCLVDEPSFERHVTASIKAALRFEPYLV